MKRLAFLVLLLLPLAAHAQTTNSSPTSALLSGINGTSGTSGTVSAASVSASSTQMATGWDTIYQTIWDRVMVPIAAKSDVIAQSLLSTANQWVLWAVVPYLMIFCVVAFFNFENAFFLKMIGAALAPPAVVVTILTAAQYNSFCRDWLVALPTDIGSIMSGVSGGPNDGTLFDKLSQQLSAAEAAVQMALPWSALALAITVGFVWLVGLAGVMICFIMFCASKLLLYLVLALGPLFVATFAFGPTRFIGKGAATFAVGTIIVQLAVLVVLTILLSVTTPLVDAMAAQNGQNINVMSIMSLLLNLCLLVAACAFLTTKVSTLAIIANGLITGIGDWTTGASAAIMAYRAGMMTARGAVGVGGAAGAAARPAMTLARRMMA